MADALHQRILLIDESGSQLRSVDIAAALCHELVAVVGEVGLHQLLRIVDDAHGGDGVQAQMGPHQQRLGVRIADAADTAASGKFAQIVLELGPKRRIFNVVNLTLEAALAVVQRHAAAPGSQVGMVVRPEEDVQHNVFLGDCSE